MTVDLGKKFLSLKDEIDKGSVVFPDIVRDAIRNHYQKRDNFEWKGTLRPSSMSFDMCVYEYIYGGAAEWTDRGWRMSFYSDLGSALHEVYQKRFMKSRRRWKGEVNLSQVPPSRRNEMVDYLAEGNLEIPVWLPWDQIGFCDGVAVARRKPVPFDFKFKFAGNEEKWEEFKNSMLPLEENIAQLCIYTYQMIDLGYFPVEPEYIDIVYCNVHLFPAETALYECVIPYTKYAEQTKILMEEGERQWQAFHSGEDLGCLSTLCKKHNKKEKEPK